MKRKVFFSLAVFFVAFCFTAVALAEDVVKIATVEPLSGSFKDIGERYNEGVEYAVKVLNGKGGLLGRKIELITVDSELKPDVATRKATKLLLKDGVKFFSAGTGTPVGVAMSKLVEQNNAIYFTYGQEAASMTGANCSRNFFRICPNSDTHSYAMAGWVAQKGFKRVACIAQDYSFGHEATIAFKKKLKELNPSANIVTELYHKLGEKDFAPYVSQIINSKPDIIFTPNWGNDLTLLLRQAKPLGLKARMIGYFMNDDYCIRTVANDEAVIGSIACEVYMLNIPTKANQEFVKGFHKDKGYYPSWIRGKSYGGIMFWAEAVRKAGSLDVDAVIKAWEGLTYEGIAGSWYMRPCDHQAQVPLWISEIVKDNPYFKHAYVGGTPTMIPAKDVEVPCAETGCPGLGK